MALAPRWSGSDGGRLRWSRHRRWRVVERGRIGRRWPAPVTPRRALVIGDSAGIGQAIVRRLVADGYHVTGLARREPTFTHERYTHAYADVRAPELRTQLTKLVEGFGAPLDVCIY